MIQKLVAIYARVSTIKQEDDGTIETQLMALREYAEKNNLKIVKEYIDDGWSGDTLERPEIDRMRLEIKEAIFDAVLTYDRDRIARRYSYQELVIDEVLEAGKEMLYVTTVSPKNGEEKILTGVKGLFAEYERMKITERMRLGKLRKIKAGHLLGTGESLYGYTYHKTIYNNGVVVQQGYYTINEEEIKNVRLIFDLVGNHGYTIYKVIEKLYEMGIKPRKSKKGTWANSTLRTMLRNTAYVGKARWNSSVSTVAKNPHKTEKYRRQKKTSKKILPKEEWQFVDIPQSIDSELFNRVQEQLTSNFKNCNRNKVNNYLVGNLIYCPCGERRCGSGVNKDRKNLYYRCNDKVTSYPLPKKCFEQALIVQDVDEVVWNKVSNLLTNEDLLTQQYERWRKEISSNDHLPSRSTSTLSEEIAKRENELDRYNKAYGAGAYSLEELQRYMEPAKLHILKLQKELEEVQKENDISKNQIIHNPQKSIQEMIDIVKNHINQLSFEQKRGIILKTVSKVVGTREKLTIAGFVPLNPNNILNNQEKMYEQKSEYRNCRTTKRWQINPF